MSTTTVATTFEVSRVKRATNPLPEVGYRQAIQDFIHSPTEGRSAILRKELAEVRVSLADRPERMNTVVAHLERDLAREEALGGDSTRTVEACSRYHGRLVGSVRAHPMVSALNSAFADHRPIVLSPDMIWLLICQGVADHINTNSEALRGQFVRHEGKSRIEVRRDDFIKGSPENPWGEVIDEFSAQIREGIGLVHDLFIPRFSTTTPTARIAAEVALMDAMKSYFEYVVWTLCGIPSITLEGTADDWRDLDERSREFSRFGLEWWTCLLRPILREFADAAGGEIRRDFWESMYKYESRSGGASITGWILSFFPYLKDQRGLATRPNPWIRPNGDDPGPVEDEQGRRTFRFVTGPSPDEFPSGLARAPFQWNYLDESFPMEFLGGFVGVAQDPTTLVLRPEIGWAVASRPEA